MRRSKRRTHRDRRLREERTKGRRENKPKSREEVEEKREKVSKRRSKYEKKLPYDRWEVVVRWKGRRKDSNTRRRQENQEERRPRLKEVMAEYEDMIRYYELKPREYRAYREETVSERPNGKKGTGRPSGEEWGRWKTYREGETDRIKRRKRGILTKKTVSKGKGSEWRAWERGTYYPEYGKRRTRQENRRKVRRSSYNLPKTYTEVTDKTTRKGSEDGYFSVSPWRQLGLETGKNPNGPRIIEEKAVVSRPMVRHQPQIIAEKLVIEVEQENTSKDEVKYEWNSRKAILARRCRLWKLSSKEPVTLKSPKNISKQLRKKRRGRDAKGQKGKLGKKEK